MADFDDIFGDLKEDQQSSASHTTITTDFDDDDIFRDVSAPVVKPVDKPPIYTASTPVPAPVPDAPPAPVAPPSDATSGGGEDEFLSWLDDGPPPSVPTFALAPTTAYTPSPSSMRTIDLGGDDDDDFLSTMAPSTASTYTPAPTLPLSPSIPIHVAAPASTLSSTISLDDDDDDLEKIIEQAKQHAKQQAASANSSESDSNSLRTRSQSKVQPQYDVAALHKGFIETGILSTPAARLPMWKHALHADVSSISMYAVQTTPLDFPNQSLLRKEVESVCSTIFSSAIHAESVSSAPSTESIDATRLLFIDNAEVLITYVCKKLQLSEYPPNLALTFAPAIAASGNDPLRLDLIATFTMVTQRVLPYLGKQISVHDVAEARRAYLPCLLHYHAPSVAFYLDQHYTQWPRAIPDTWIASMFENNMENDSMGDGFDFLLKIWDCCLLLDTTKTYPAIIMCFILCHLITKAEKKLIRMEGEQLRACMMQTLVDALQDTNEHLVQGVEKLMYATPASFCNKLCDAGGIAPPSATTLSAQGTDNISAKKFSLISASANGVMQAANGVMQVGNGVMQVGALVMVDMPTKLLTTMVPLKSTKDAAATAANAAAAEEYFGQLIMQAAATSALCMSLSAKEVIPQVFRSFQGPRGGEKIRYFMIDCRASDERSQGQVPTAFHFDLNSATDPAALEAILATLNPMKSTVHMCVMGHGYGQLADELRGIVQNSASDQLPFYLQEEFLDSFARDVSRVNAAVLFLMKRGFPYVSVLEGGYTATHAQLLRSHGEGFSVADLIDHDAPHCTFCQHQPHSASFGARAATSSFSSQSSGGNGSATNSFRNADGSSSATNSFSNSGRTGSRQDSSSMMQSSPKLSGSGERDAKALFEAHASPSNSYLKSFAGALKTSSKVMMNPADSLMAGNKWLQKKTGTSSKPSSPGAPGDSTKSPTSLLGNKLKSSLSAIGAESMEMMRKAENAAAKGFGSSSMSGNVKPVSVQSPASTPANHASGHGNSRNASFQKADEDVFSIDDDEEEEQDDFVGGSGGSLSSSASSSRSASFATGGGEGGAGSGLSSTLVLHNLEKDRVKDLRKGMRVSRSQMLPFLDSPFFSAYKKKKAATSPTAATTASRSSMLPRRLVVAENHIIVLKAERNTDDIYVVKSCHSLAHIARMTCLKKNALMVTIYYKWKQPHNGQIEERKNSYECQQRDEFIKVIKSAMEKM